MMMSSSEGKSRSSWSHASCQGLVLVRFVNGTAARPSLTCNARSLGNDSLGTECGARPAPTFPPYVWC